ncbi:MAG: hypothetical protein WC544_05080, partial [Patescibacteria group bacterium]
MSYFTSLFDKIVLYDPSKSRSTCHIFISHQSPAEEKSLGRLVVTAEIESRDGVNLSIINAIQDELKQRYFNTDDLNIETAFEKALEGVNQKIADMVGDYDTNWLDRFNACAAVVKNDVIHFSFVGHINAFLFRQEKITNIIDSTATESLAEKINPLKAFSSVISGNLSPEDTVVFCTSSILDFLSQEKLRRIVTEKTPHDAVSALDSILSEGSGQTAFAAAIIKIALSQEPAVQQIVQPAYTAPTPASPLNAPQASMDELIQKQANTSQVLAPSLSRYIMGLLRSVFQNISYFIRVTVFRQSPRRARMAKDFRDYRPTEQPSIEKPRTGSSLASQTGQHIKRFGGVAQRMIASMAWLFRRTSDEKHTTPITSDRRSLAQRLTGAILWFKRLPVLSRILLLCVMAVAFFLAQGLFTSLQNKQLTAQSVEYDQTINAISDNLTRAEASLSYGDEDGAKKLLASAADLISQLPDKTKDEKAKIDELRTSLAVQLEKTKHIITVESPTLITDLAQTDPAVAPKDLAIAGASVYVTDPSTKKLYGITITGGDVASWQRDATGTFQYLTGEGQNTLLYLDTANGAGEFSVTAKKFTELSFTPPTPEVNIIGVAVYEGRLYFADINGNQVYRAARSGNAFGTSSVWIKDGTSVSNAVSLAVDGNIYILYKDGTTYKFTLGQRQDWSLSAIEPAMTHGDKIWTTTAAANIYVLDAPGHR